MTIAGFEHAFRRSLEAKIQHWRVARLSVEGDSATLSAIVLSCTNRGWTTQQTADYVGCPVELVTAALTRGLKALATTEILSAQEYRAKIAGKLEGIDAQLQALVDAADSPDTAIRALEARRKVSGDLSTLYGANASRHNDDSADAIAELLSRVQPTLTEAQRTANEPATPALIHDKPGF